MKSFFIKVGLELVNLLFNNRFFFWVCRKFGLIQSVFCAYPASEKYSRYFSFRFRQARITWVPYMIGVAKQRSGLTLMFAVGATESEITDRNQGDNLFLLNERMELIREKTGAKSNHFAGVFPSYLSQRGIRRDQVEQRVTVDAVTKSVRNVDPDHKIKKVILLGCRGYIGSQVMEKLKVEYDVLGVEKGEQYRPPAEKHIVLNISVPYAIKDHLESFNGNTVIVNEVYPAPHKHLLKAIKDKGAQIFHIAGIRATMIPSLPGDYGGAMPCCGGIEDHHNEVVMREM